MVSASTGKKDATKCHNESDEQYCKVLALQHDYNKKVPPNIVKPKKNKGKKRLPVNVYLTLQKVIAIQEVDYSISFKFKITLRGYERRVNYQNLKTDSTNNMLTKE